MKLEMKKVRNGWLCRDLDDEDPDAIWVQEEPWEKEEEAFVQLLWHIIDNFAPNAPYSKYSEKTIVPVILPGRDFMGKLDDESIEKLTDLRNRIQHALDDQEELRKKSN
jgi:hypothetical protein